MFKSLLNTLPLICGNHTIACKVNDVSKKSDTQYYVYIHQAELKPLNTNSSLPTSINLNLNNGKYAFDIKRYASITNIFTNDYIFNPHVFKNIDTENYIADRNKTFEFGCQRISYQQNKFEWSFYAPIYINNIEDLPDYFVIEIKSKTTNKIIKQIKIAIKAQYQPNNLFYYIKNHLKYITDNIPIIWHYNNHQIVLNNVIDCKTGTIITNVTNSNNQLFYNNHVTINEFDSMLTNLYSNNNVIISEVLPLSFEFNLNDFFEETKSYYFDFNSFNICGYYEKSGVHQSFYMFDVNTHSNTNTSLIFNTQHNTLEYKQYNVYDYNKEGTLHEAKNKVIKHTNTVNKTYCKWVNFDNDSYTINNNSAYSSVTNRKYGFYPLYKSTSNNIKLICKYNNEDLNIIVPIYNYSTAESSGYTDNDINIYKSLMENNITTWFDVYDEQTFNNFDLWTDVNKYNNTCFCKGLIYHKLPDDASKFNVFVKLNYITTDKLKYANVLYDPNVLSLENKSKHDIYNNLPVINNSYIIKVDASNINSSDTYYVHDNDYNTDEYYMMLDDLADVCKSSQDLINDCIKYNIIKIIHDYVYINELTVNQIIEHLTEVTEEQKTNIYYFDDTYNKFEHITNISLNNLNETKKVKLFKYCQIIYLPTSSNILSLVKDIINSYNYINVSVQNIEIASNVINKVKYANDIINLLTELLSNNNLYQQQISTLICALKYYIEKLNCEYSQNSFFNDVCGVDIQKYYYSINNDININYFKPYDKKYYNLDNVYVDSFNLYQYFKANNLTVPNNKSTSYSDFINKDHVIEYFNQLYQENFDNKKSTKSIKEIFDTLYIKTYELKNFKTKVKIKKFSTIIKYDFNVLDEKLILKYFLNGLTYNENDKTFELKYTFKSDDSNSGKYIAYKHKFQLMFKKRFCIISNDNLKKLQQLKLYLYTNNTDLSDHILLSPVYDDVYLSDTFIDKNRLFITSRLNNTSTKNYNNMFIYKQVSYDDVQSYINNGVDVYQIYNQFNHAIIDTTNDSKLHYVELPDNTKAYYILINEYLSYNTISYNINNKMYNDLDIKYVNNNSISKDDFYILYPFLKNDIFYDVVPALRDYVVLPTNIKLLQKYQVSWNNEKTENELVLKTPQTYLNLNRYFYNIQPSFININDIIPDMYGMIFKTKDCNINNDKYESYYQNVNCNLYKNTDICYITDIKDISNNLKTYHPVEIKHFQNNELYHLPISLEISINKTIVDDEIVEYEKQDTAYEYFKNYIKNHYYNTVDNDSLLFLFNKYSYKVTKNIAQYNIALNVRLYEIIYIFTLK